MLPRNQSTYQNNMDSNKGNFLYKVPVYLCSIEYAFERHPHSAFQMPTHCGTNRHVLCTGS